jgi:hypothetical protein
LEQWQAVSNAMHHGTRNTIGGGAQNLALLLAILSAQPTAHLLCNELKVIIREAISDQPVKPVKGKGISTDP